MDDLISRQTAVDALENNRFPGAPYVDTGIQIAIWTIQGLPSAQPEQQWIPCSKRTPTAKHKTYWICTDTGYQCECRWTNVNLLCTGITTEWHWHIMDIPQYSKVVAWRELPDPWEGENNE